MNIYSLKVLIETDGVEYLDQECANKALSLLRSVDVSIVGDGPTLESVDQLLPTLKARLEVSKYTGKQIFGLVLIIDRLEGMQKSDKIIGYGLISSNAAGKVYLDEKNMSLLGVIVVDSDIKDARNL